MRIILILGFIVFALLGTDAYLYLQKKHKTSTQGEEVDRVVNTKVVVTSKNDPHPMDADDIDSYHVRIHQVGHTKEFDVEVPEETYKLLNVGDTTEILVYKQ